MIEIQKHLKVNQSYLSNSIHGESFEIEDLINESLPLNLIDQEVIDSMYILEIGKILSEHSIYDTSRMILNLESKLKKLEKIVKTDIEIPELRTFYFSLTPVLLQSFVETKDITETLELQEHWLEAIKIALEEELSLWQEKMKS